MLSLALLAASLGDPSPAAELKLVTSELGLHDHFGRTLDVDGDTLVSGSRFDETCGVGLAGSATIFEREGAQWFETVKLTASDKDVQDLFGHAVAISGDTVLVGARNDDHAGGVDAGSAYIFERVDGEWLEQVQLIASDTAAGDFHGISVAIEGDTALVGATSADVSGFADAGAVYVYEREAGVWSQQAKLVAPDPGEGDNFGWFVAISGETALIGARYDDLPGAVDAGSAYVFVRDAGVWTPEAKLTAFDAAAGDQAGKYVELKGDTALVSAPLDDHTVGVQAGSVRVFERDAGVWTETAFLTSSDVAPLDEFGHSLALVGDDLIVGCAKNQLDGILLAGSAYRFRRDGSTWTEVTKYVASDPVFNQNTGTDVGLSGNAVLIGSPHDNVDDVIHSGSIYVYPLEPDCDGNGIADADELTSGAGVDCDGNGVLDACEIATGAALDLDGEGTPDVCQALSADVAALSIGSGGSLAFTLNAGTAHAGQLYLLLGTAAGTMPGVPLDGQLLPLNVDDYLLATLTGGSPIQGSTGLLDAAGQASAQLTLGAGQAPSDLIGLTVHHAFLTLDLLTGQVSSTSNAIPTDLLP